MRLAFATLAATLAAAPAFAASEPTPATFPAGAVGCVNHREAKNYTAYSKNAPKFAEQLLARAVCHVNKEDRAAVIKTVVGDYTQLELLSGHRVWLENTYLTAK
jgi:hypothetical protein